MRSSFSAHLIHLGLFPPIAFDEGYEIWSSSLCNFLHPAVIRPVAVCSQPRSDYESRIMLAMFQEESFIPDLFLCWNHFCGTFSCTGRERLTAWKVVFRLRSELLHPYGERMKEVFIFFPMWPHRAKWSNRYRIFYAQVLRDSCGQQISYERALFLCRMIYVYIECRVVIPSVCFGC